MALPRRRSIGGLQRPPQEPPMNTGGLPDMGLPDLLDEETAQEQGPAYAEPAPVAPRHRPRRADPTAGRGRSTLGARCRGPQAPAHDDDYGYPADAHAPAGGDDGYGMDARYGVGAAPDDGYGHDRARTPHPGTAGGRVPDRRGAADGQLPDDGYGYDSPEGTDGYGYTEEPGYGYTSGSDRPYPEDGGPEAEPGEGRVLRRPGRGPASSRRVAGRPDDTRSRYAGDDGQATRPEDPRRRYTDEAGYRNPDDGQDGPAGYDADRFDADEPAPARRPARRRGDAAAGRRRGPAGNDVNRPAPASRTQGRRSRGPEGNDTHGSQSGMKRDQRSSRDDRRPQEPVDDRYGYEDYDDEQYGYQTAPTHDPQSVVYDDEEPMDGYDQPLHGQAEEHPQQEAPAPEPARLAKRRRGTPTKRGDDGSPATNRGARGRRQPAQDAPAPRSDGSTPRTHIKVPEGAIIRDGRVYDSTGTYDVTDGYPRGLPEGPVVRRRNPRSRKNAMMDIHGVPIEELHNKAIRKQLDAEPLDAAGNLRVFILDPFENKYVELGSPEGGRELKRSLESKRDLLAAGTADIGASDERPIIDRAGLDLDNGTWGNTKQRIYSGMHEEKEPEPDKGLLGRLFGGR